MTSGNKSRPSHQKFFVSFSLLLILLLSTILCADFPRSANAEMETNKSTVAGAARLSKNITGGCCGGDEGNNKPHHLAGTYYTVNNNFSAKLLLNNKGPLPIEVRPTLFSLSGDRFEAAPVTVDANSHRFENFADWAAIAGEQFREGSIQLFHHGKDLVLGSQIYLTDESHSLSFDEKLTELGKRGSARLAGVWWLPSPKGGVKLVLSNTTNTKLSVSTTIRGKSPKREVGTTVEVGPHETIVSPRSVESNQYRSGTIEGSVTDFAGLPVPNATVYVLQNGRTPACVSDTKGNFVVTNVAIGKQRVFAYKESDNYPNPVWSFYGDAHSQEGFPLVTVRENGPLRNVIVRLGPKSARLLMTVSDARTKQPISGAAVLLNHEGKPKTLFNPGAVGPSGELTVLIPVGVPVKLKVTAEGYQTWNYRDRNSKPPDAIQLKTGENKSMKIELTKVYTAPAQ